MRNMGHNHISETYTSESDPKAAPESPDMSGADLKIALVVSDFNGEISAELERGAVDELIRNGVMPDDISILRVPGAFELPLGAQSVFEKSQRAFPPQGVDAVICLGCVIRGETSHYDFICNSCAAALQTVALKYGKPVIAGVLTTENIEQARARSGGDKGHKGRESALAALQMNHALSTAGSLDEGVESFLGSTAEPEASHTG